jgi:hypothetical protein
VGARKSLRESGSRGAIGAGVYFVRLGSGGRLQTRKIVLVNNCVVVII